MDSSVLTCHYHRLQLMWGLTCGVKCAVDWVDALRCVYTIIASHRRVSLHLKSSVPLAHPSLFLSAGHHVSLYYPCVFSFPELSACRTDVTFQSGCFHLVMWPKLQHVSGWVALFFLVANAILLSGSAVVCFSTCLLQDISLDCFGNHDESCCKYPCAGFNMDPNP